MGSSRITPLLRSQLIAPSLAFAQASGASLDGLLEQLGLPSDATTQREVTVSLPTLYALWDELERRTQDPLFGLHLGAVLARGHYGLVEYLCRTAPTFGAALDCIARFAHLLDETAEVERVNVAWGCEFIQHIPGAPLALGRHGNECWISNLVHRARELAGQRFPMRAVLLAHASGPGATLGEALDAKRVVFGQEHNALHVPRQTAELPIRSADPVLHQLLVAQAEAALGERNTTSRYLGLVRQAVREQLRSGLPTLEGSAALLKCSARWLQRRLAKEQTHFNQVLDGVREDLARALAADPARSVGDVSFELKYSDPSVFIRAFKRWTGMTPGQFRAAEPAPRAP